MILNPDTPQVRYTCLHILVDVLMCKNKELAVQLADMHAKYGVVPADISSNYVCYNSISKMFNNKT